MDKGSQPWCNLFVRTIGSLIVATAVYVIGICIYRVTLHPLAKYPGPLLSKITDWSIVLQARSGDRHLKTWEEHEKYGSVVRIGPNTLSFNTDIALKTIYSSRKSNVIKSDWYRTIDAGSKAFSLHSEIDPVRHAFRRRVVNRAFSKTTTATESLILKDINKFLDSLGADADPNNWTEPKKMEDWCDWLSLDVMGLLTFGRGFGCVEGSKNRIVSQLALEATKFLYVAGFLPFISLVRPLLCTKWAAILFIKDAKMGQDWNTLVSNLMQGCITKYQENKSYSTMAGPTDFISHLLEMHDPETGQGLTLNELHADSALLIHAGSHTTAITLSAAIFYLTRPNHEHILESLQKKVRMSFSSVEDICPGAKLSSLEYLRAVIDETLRMSPPVPSHLPREVLPGGLEIDGQYFPQGTIVGVAPWAVHHNAEYYPDPFKFDPERWLSKGDDKERVARARVAFCPFSIGPRGCAGKGMAYDKISLVLAKLLWVYDVRSVPTTATDTQQSSGSRHTVRAREDVYQIRDYFVAEGAGIKVELRRRAW